MLTGAAVWHDCLFAVTFSSSLSVSTFVSLLAIVYNDHCSPRQMAIAVPEDMEAFM